MQLLINKVTPTAHLFCLSGTVFLELFFWKLWSIGILPKFCQSHLQTDIHYKNTCYTILPYQKFLTKTVTLHQKFPLIGLKLLILQSNSLIDWFSLHQNLSTLLYCRWTIEILMWHVVLLDSLIATSTDVTGKFASRNRRKVDNYYKILKISWMV